MTPEEIRTLNLFKTVENKPEINQRQLAQELDVSLGLTNAYFKRVLKKGWIRAKQVKSRRWLYFLTPKGALEKSRLSISYLNRTLESFRELKIKGDENLNVLYKKGVTGIHLCGDEDFTEILSFCFSGSGIELLSVILEKFLLEDDGRKKNINLPELKNGEIFLIASLGNQEKIIKYFEKNGFKKKSHWILFS